MINSEGIVRVSPLSAEWIDGEDWDQQVYISGSHQSRISAEYWRMCGRTAWYPHPRALQLPEGDFVMGSVLEEKKQQLADEVTHEALRGVNNQAVREEAAYLLNGNIGSMYEVTAYIIGSCLKVEWVISQEKQNCALVRRKLQPSERKLIDPQLSSRQAAARYSNLKDNNEPLFDLMDVRARTDRDIMIRYRQNYFEQHVNPESEESMGNGAVERSFRHHYKQAAFIMLQTCALTTELCEIPDSVPEYFGADDEDIEE